MTCVGRPIRGIYARTSVRKNSGMARIASRHPGGLVRCWLLGLLGGLAGCAPPPPPPPPTVVNVNPDGQPGRQPDRASGQGTPLQVVVYQLGSASGFRQRRVLPVVQPGPGDAEADLVKKDQFILAPGQDQDRPDARRSGQGDRHVRRLSELPDRHLARHGRHAAAPDHQRHRAPPPRAGVTSTRPPQQARILTMGWENKVVWTEGSVPPAAAPAAAGPLLRAAGAGQHRRAAAVQLGADPARTRCRTADAGQVRGPSAAGILPDGTPFSVPDDVDRRARSTCRRRRATTSSTCCCRPASLACGDGAGRPGGDGGPLRRRRARGDRHQRRLSEHRQPCRSASCACATRPRARARAGHAALGLPASPRCAPIRAWCWTRATSRRCWSARPRRAGRLRHPVAGAAAPSRRGAGRAGVRDRHARRRRDRRLPDAAAVQPLRAAADAPRRHARPVAPGDVLPGRGRPGRRAGRPSPRARKRPVAFPTVPPRRPAGDVPPGDGGAAAVAVGGAGAERRADPAAGAQVRHPRRPDRRSHACSPTPPGCWRSRRRCRPTRCVAASPTWSRSARSSRSAS